MPYPPQKKLKKKKKKLRQQRQMPQFHKLLQNANFKLLLQMQLGQLQEKISKASLPVSAGLINDFKSIILETAQRKIYPS